MRTSAGLHSLQKGAININRRRKDILVGDINFEVFEQMSKSHPAGMIPTRNHEMLQKHGIDEKLRDVDSNTF